MVTVLYLTVPYVCFLLSWLSFCCNVHLNIGCWSLNLKAQNIKSYIQNYDKIGSLQYSWSWWMIDSKNLKKENVMSNQFKETWERYVSSWKVKSTSDKRALFETCLVLQRDFDIKLRKCPGFWPQKSKCIRHLTTFEAKLNWLTE